MDIDQGRVEGLMSHKVLDRQKIRAVFIQMGSESMSEGMAGKPVFPAKGILMGPHVPADIKSINWTCGVCLFWEKPFFRAAGMEPVLRENIQGFPGKDGISVRAVLGVGNVDSHMFPFNIAVPQAADLTDPESGGIHEGDHSFWFQIRQCGDKNLCLFPGRDKGEIRIELPHRKLGRIPGLVQHIHGEETELRNAVIDRAIRKRALFLQPADKIPEFTPGDIFGLFVEKSLEIVQVGTDISRIRHYSMVSQTAEGDHLPVNF